MTSNTPTPARPALDEGDEPTPEAILIAAWKLRFNKAFRPEEEAGALMAFLDTVGLCVVSKRALADMRATRSAASFSKPTPTEAAMRDARDKRKPLLSAIRLVMQGHVQKTLAAKMRISQQYLSELLNGRKDWSPDLIDSLVAALNRDWIDGNKLHRLGARAQGWKIP